MGYGSAGSAHNPVSYPKESSKIRQILDFEIQEKVRKSVVKTGCFLVKSGKKCRVIEYGGIAQLGAHIIW